MNQSDLIGLPRIANIKCRKYVQNREPFRGSNLYGINSLVDADHEVYTVYSYGDHYPMFIYTEGMWFENEDKYSPTTSKQRGQAHPHTPTILLSTQWMKRLANNGYQGIAKERILTTEPMEA